MSHHHLLLWTLFNAVVLALLAMDWLVLQRNASQPGMSSAWIATSFWVGLAAAFALGLYAWLGRTPAIEFTAAYIVEESLSIDNLFIFLLIFKAFGVPRSHQRKTLLWGVLGAMVMRLTFILAGIGLIERFQWVTYLLGAFLVYVGVRTIKGRPHAPENRRLAVGNWVRRFIPLTGDFVGEHFFVRRERWFATPLLLVLIVIELTDLTFALDSIPAVLGITHNAFIAYASNVFAILGLRSLYFLVAGMMTVLRFLPQGLAVVLIFVGSRMLLSRYWSISTEAALGVVMTTLALTALLSLMFRDQKLEGRS